MDHFTVVIPARYASTRLPGKPLIDLGGKPMILRVVEQALLSSARRVIVATDDQRIADVLSTTEVEVAMTSPDHTTGSDRLWEVASHSSFEENDVLVNVQGDEPLIPPNAIDQVAAVVLDDQDVGVATLCESIKDVQDVMDPNIVKVVRDTADNALYFSRAPIPWDRARFGEEAGDFELQTGYSRHLGIYAYKRWALRRFVEFESTLLEKTESLEQLRLIENGVRIRVATSETDIPGGVDTTDDVERVRAYLRSQ